MQYYFYYVIIPNMVVIPKLTHYCQDATGCGYTVLSGHRDMDHITCWFLQGHNINNNNPSDYNIMNIYYAICVLVKILLQGQKMVYVGIHLVVLNFYVFLPGHLVNVGTE